MENLNRLIQELCNLPSETAYVEFKHDNYTPDMIGKDISALANSAALFEKRNAYYGASLTKLIALLAQTRISKQSKKAARN